MRCSTEIHAYLVYPKKVFLGEADSLTQWDAHSHIIPFVITFKNALSLIDNYQINDQQLTLLMLFKGIPDS